MYSGHQSITKGAKIQMERLFVPKQEWQLLENQTLLEAESLHDWPFWLLNISAWFFSALVCHVVLAFLRGLRSVMRSLELSQVAWTSINLLDTLSTLSWTPEKTFLQTRSFPFQAKETKKNINDEICFFLSLSSAITSFCISRSKLKFKAMMIGLR